ncbi:uncharacterized protein TrAFT101_008653 [Trichoderma asperellum]|uniref:uncharacterized protein n=1 Tax=Trichoderma asperellum TaxID=101201 RepID=UPI00332709F2|nr:hypothetical protein TrAFT101_008653 [Trichoderma asperellum]
MGTGQSTPPIKHRLQQAFRLPLVRKKRITDSEPQQPEKLEITVTQTMTQETTPIARSDNTPRRSPVRSPPLLTINADAALSPSGSPAGVALGIPAEHILDENASEIDAPMPRLTLSNLAAMTEAEAFTVSDTPSSLTTQGSGRSHSGTGATPVPVIFAILNTGIISSLKCIFPVDILSGFAACMNGCRRDVLIQTKSDALTNVSASDTTVATLPHHAVLSHIHGLPTSQLLPFHQFMSSAEREGAEC